ncbi:MAG: dihydroorotate dehydrogenase electron transfer subunit [bacterium]
MIQTKGKILVNDNIAPEYYKMALKSPEIVKTAKPGQFVHIKVSESYDPLLRRPFSIHSIKNSDIVEILYRVVGKGTELLSEKKVGEELDILGPLGNGFKINNERKIVIIGGGAGIAPLFFLTQKAIASSNNIIVLIGAKTKRLILCEQEFKDLGVAVQIATEDGSYGHKGLVTDLLNQFSSASISLFACGPSIMLREVAIFSHKHNLPCQVSLESRMACGVGACLGCAIKVKGEVKTISKRVCSEGPVFAAKEIVFE